MEGEFETHDGISLEDVPEADITKAYIEPYGLENFEQFHEDYKKFLAEIIPEDEEEEEEEHAEVEKNKDSTVEPSEVKDIEKSIQESKKLEKEREYQRQTYMHIVSSATAGEAAHKLLKVQKETKGEFDTIIINTCINYIGLEKTFNRNLGLLVQFLCNASKSNTKLVENCFSESYNQCHKYSTYRITNLACLYAYLLSTNSISWSVLSIIRLTEEDTTSAQRVFIRFLTEEIAKAMSYSEFIKKLNEPNVIKWTSGLLLTDTLEHAEFVVLFFTHINLGFILERVNQEVLRMTQELNKQRIEEFNLVNNIKEVHSEEETENESNDNISDSSDKEEILIDNDDFPQHKKHKHHHHRH